MPREAVSQVKNVLIHLQTDVVARLDIVAGKTWAAIVRAVRGEACGVARRGIEAGRKERRRNRIGVKRKRDTVQLVAVDGIKVKVLITEPEEQLVRPNGGRTLAENGAEIVVGRGYKRFQRSVIGEANAGGWRSDRQL